jgi:RimJ/RimL family protein N-acetyltransferase
MTKILETERLNLREVDEMDDEFVLDLLNQPSFMENIGDRMVRDKQGAREYIASRFVKSYRENGFGLYLVELKSGIPIGISGLVKRDSLPDLDIGFAFLPEYCGVGYALESAAAVMKYSLATLNLERIVAITTQTNDSSIKLLKKLGFSFESLIKQPHDDEELNLFSFSIK